MYAIRSYYDLLCISRCNKAERLNNDATSGGVLASQKKGGRSLPWLGPGEEGLRPVALTYVSRVLLSVRKEALMADKPELISFKL